MERLALKWTHEGDDLIVPLPAADAAGTMTLGRDPTCDIVLPDLTVSRQHAEVFARDGRAHIRHISSTNPTYLNGDILVGEEPLVVGDVLQLPVIMVRVVPLEEATAESP